MKPTVESSRVGHKTEGVANIVVDVFSAAPYCGDDNDFPLLQ